MAVVWAHGASVLLASCRRGPPPESLQHLEVLVARWDSTNDCFASEARIAIPVAGDAQLLTGGWVADSETGLFQSYLVIEQNSSLSIGCLDLGDESFELVAELSLPPSGGKLKTCMEDCWLANGPTVFSLWNGQLLVATSKCPELGTVSATMESSSGMKTSHSDPTDYTWEAHLLEVSDSTQQQPVKIHFCGEMRRDGYPEAILSVGSLNSTQARANSNSERCLPSWLYITLVESAIDPSMSQKLSHSAEKINRPFQLALSEHLPAELEPDMVSCLQTVAASPCSVDVPHDVLIGTKDRRLLRCRLGHVVKVVHLDDIPTHLYFAVVAGGQGVIVVVLNGSQQNGLAICAESHEKLQDWSRIWQVVIGDFTLSGHDQIVLLQGSTDSIADCELYAPFAENNLNFTVIHGFSSFTCPGTPQGSQQHLNEVKAINDHKVSSLEAIAKALHERVEAGLAELKVVEDQREFKRELYQLSSRVMQGMVAKHALESNSSPVVDMSIEQGKNLEQDDLRMVQIKKVESRICGTNWLLMIDVEILEARPNIILHHVSLLVTSLNGLISGRSSVLRTLTYTEGSRCLVTSIPLQTISLLPGFPVHVFLKAAQVSSGKSSPNLESRRDFHLRHPREYTQWLCHSEVIHPTSVQTLCAKEAITLIGRASVQRQFVVASESKECILQLAGRMRSTLSMQDSVDEKQEQSAGRFNLMSVTGLGIACANLRSVGKHAVITLKASNARLMAMLQQSFILLIHQHRFQLLPRICYFETLEKMKLLADALVEELGVMDSLKQREDGKRLDSLESRHEDKSSILHLQRLQMATDRRCAEVCSVLT